MVVGGGGWRLTTEACPDGTRRNCGMASGMGLTTGRRGKAGATGGATADDAGAGVAAGTDGTTGATATLSAGA